MKTLAHDFESESQALADLVAPLDEARLETATAFKAWTINMVLRHLHIWNLAAQMSLQDDGSFDAFIGKLGEHRARGGTMSAFERSWLKGLEGSALRAAWTTGFKDTAEAFAGADPAARLKWAGPPMSARSSLTARLMETWAHGQEIYDVLGATRQNRDWIRNIVVLGNNTYGWTFKVRGEDAPSPRPHLRLTAPSGEIWRFNDASEEELIEGLADEFCQVVTQTRNIADTRLRVTGPNATSWMAKAQCFAGAAETPPAPGSRAPQRTTRG